MSYKNMLNLDYHPALIETMSKGTLAGVFASNLIAPLVVLFVLYDFVPHNYLYMWVFLHIMILIARVVIAKKSLLSLKIGDNSIIKKLSISLILTSLSAVLYSIVVWQSVLYEAPELNIFIVAMSMVALAAGSTSTLGSIFHSFAFFFILMIAPLIAAMMYHGGEMFSVLSFILVVFMIVNIISGYRQYIVLRDAVSLKETFKTIFNQATDGVMLIKDARLKDCNDALVVMFGYSSKEEFLNTHLLKFSPEYQPDGTSSIRKMFMMFKIALRDEVNSFEWLHKKADGGLFWTEIVLTHIHLAGEDLIHGVWRDITQRKELEVRLQDYTVDLEKRIKEEVLKNREKDRQVLQQSRLAQMGEMISMIAHQWRQPLNAISATAANLRLKLMMDNINRDYFTKEIAHIDEYSQHLSRTIDDFRGFFKENKQTESTTLEEIVNSVMSIIKISLENKNIEISTKFSCNKTVNTYVNEVQQVVLNLIKNAEDALLDNSVLHPKIEVETWCKENKRVLCIKDNGGGVPKELIDKIFDPYFSTKKAKNGIGLGLYMSKTIIEDHCKGKLHVHNDSEGAVFTMTLEEVNNGH